jgi:hypothetical protein
MLQKLINIVVGAWQVLGDMAPWLLIGFAVAGVLSVMVSSAWVQRHLGGGGIMPVIKATLFGVPLPLCSCGVIPVTAGMYRQGASRGAASAFLLATPQTGVDSIFATYALLGPVFAVVRPVVALVSGIFGGAVIDLVDRREADNQQTDDLKSCSDCHDDDVTGGNKFSRMLRYGFVTLPGDIAWAMMVGVVVAGVLGAFIQQDQFESLLGGGITAMLLMMLVGTPLYVCSTASIPLALGFMHLGASPGAALVFLITGPATNAATISVMWKLLGRRTAIIYLLTVVISALIAGWLLDKVGVSLPMSSLGHAHDQTMGVMNHISAAVLIFLLMFGLISRRNAKTAKGKLMTDAASETLTLQIEGMSCSHCTDTAAKAILATPGVTAATVQLSPGQAVVQGDNLDVPALVSAIRGVGYEAKVRA